MKQKSKGLYQNHLKQMKAKVEKKVRFEEGLDDWGHNALGALWMAGIVLALMLFLA